MNETILSQFAAAFDATSPARCCARREMVLAEIRKQDWDEARALLKYWDGEGWLGNGYQHLLRMLEDMRNEAN